MVDFTLLWKDPVINPVNRKAQSIPILNPLNVYARVWWMSWMSFFLAFWSWYAFPPLLSSVIAKDLDGLDNVSATLQTSRVFDSNIIALVATLLVRFASGPCCDAFGPRWTFAGILIAGAIPTFCAGGVTNYSGLLALRFFIGILGGAFVPCQVWTTGFFDKNVVGTANALTAGLGNAGGGVTYFVMPAIYDSLRKQGLTLHTAWRVAFVVPGILITFAAISLVVTCPDCPTGKWSERQQAAESSLRQHSVGGTVVDVPGHISADTNGSKQHGSESPSDVAEEEKKLSNTRGTFNDHEAHMSEGQMADTARGEVIQKPSFGEAVKVLMSPSTLVTAACYFCTFGCELAVNSNLGAYYAKQFPKLPLQLQGNWAAMFGLLNVVFRPIGGFMADFLYRRTHNLWAKKALLHSYVLITGAFMVAIGATDPKGQHTMFGLIAGLAFFLEGANGANYALVPHVHPYANGIVSGFTGASGNLGGIVFSCIFRSYLKNYGKSFWVIGVVIMTLNLAVAWIPPISKKQVGGR